MKLNRLLKTVRVCFFLSLLATTACRPDPDVVVEPIKSVKEFDSKVLQEWQDLFLEVERYAEIYRPCPTARMCGYLGLAAYESAISGMPEYQSLAPRIPGLQVPRVENGKEYHWPTVINNVYGTLFKNFFAKSAFAGLFQNHDTRKLSQCAIFK
ncbi:MAG: hypothetical protein HC817_14065 [Saprospiraceae bacterium]|nr:hypothetical protein [Saprospiraceae bacterium]